MRYVIIIEDAVYKVFAKQMKEIIKIKKLDDENAMAEHLSKNQNEYIFVGEILFTFRG